MFEQKFWLLTQEEMWKEGLKFSIIWSIFMKLGTIMHNATLKRNVGIRFVMLPIFPKENEFQSKKTMNRGVWGNCSCFFSFLNNRADIGIKRSAICISTKNISLLSQFLNKIEKRKYDCIKYWLLFITFSI